MSSLGPLDPGATEPKDKLAKTALSRERQLELYRLLKLNRLVEDRLTNLYRQGKVVGGLRARTRRHRRAADPQPRRHAGARRLAA